MESIGYLLRLLCTDYTDNLGKYFGMKLFLFLSPNALALVNYKAVGEIIRLSSVKAKYFYLRPKFVTCFFFSSNVFALFLQGAGGGLQLFPGSNNMGIAIALIGLSLQFIASLNMQLDMMDLSPVLNGLFTFSMDLLWFTYSLLFIGS